MKIPRVLCEKPLPGKAIDDLCSGGATGLIKGFKSPKTGKKFDARLKVNVQEKKVEFDFGTGALDTAGMTCPKCGKELSDRGSALECGCGFKLWKKAYGAPLSERQLKGILSGQKVPVKDMFSPKTKKKFSGFVELNRQTWNTELKFK